MIPVLLRPLALTAVIFLSVGCGSSGMPRCASLPPRPAVAPAALAEARGAWQRLDAADPASRARAHHAYHEALLHLFGQFRCDPSGWETAAGKQGISIASGAGLVHPDSLDGLALASEIETRSVGGRHRFGDFGLPLVGWRNGDGGQRPFAPPEGTALALSAVLRFDRERNPSWHFHRIDGPETVDVGDGRRRLAFDPSARDAVYWDSTKLDLFAVLNVFRPGRFGNGAGLFFMQPYDPRKIPLVLVHGLQSSPYTFRKLANAVSADPALRERYQLWFYSYPTGNPWTYSAAIFRRNMRAAAEFARSNGGGATLDDMVLVAHSMGGLIARASVSEPGHVLYDARFSKPVEELVLPEEGGELFREYFLYQPLQEPARVVFLAVPHRGSPMTERYIAHLVNRLIRLPITLTSLALQIVTVNVEAIAATGRDQLPTGIDTLSPRADSILALQAMPLRPDLPVHSIIGDTGIASGTPSGTDGVVPSWSSRLPAARSEKIIAADHSLTGDPAAVEEVLRILHLHLQESE